MSLLEKYSILTLGMIGTVAGFIYMLDTSFSKMDPQNVVSLQGVLSKMGVGMSTALYTTAAGLVCSLFPPRSCILYQCVRESAETML
jgi:hypothetical protein